ncbi:hypothetical protein HPB51_019430 [Rhipicephalus microplus]|uniref:Uncharacterized protein n=1 Tax=Rhipicephalus microplus TaxID=6941 RepID=A0A9J6EI37_RHIMP|nr:hypothetical protein HPB51_019430 [Rhipicephalus microplus]
MFAAVGGYLDVVQLLVASRADIDSMDNRRVSCLMAAFRRGHVKAAKWLVKQVAQFPSDQEMARFMATLGPDSRDLLRKCHQCTEVIHAAKERQAAEANKCASSLLEELDLERSREESRRAAAARRRERKRRKKKEKQEQMRLAKLEAEVGDKAAVASANNGKDSDKDSKSEGEKPPTSSQSEEDDDDDEEEEEEDNRTSAPSCGNRTAELDERLPNPGVGAGNPLAGATSGPPDRGGGLPNVPGRPKTNGAAVSSSSTPNKVRLKGDDVPPSAAHESSNSTSSSPPKTTASVVAEGSSKNSRKKKQAAASSTMERPSESAPARLNHAASPAPAALSKSSSSGGGKQAKAAQTTQAILQQPASSLTRSPLGLGPPSMIQGHRQVPLAGKQRGGELMVNGLADCEDFSTVVKGTKHRGQAHHAVTDGSTKSST